MSDEHIDRLLEKVFEHIMGPLCLQAGGGNGEYPVYLSNRFSKVVTCEPCLENWEALQTAVAGNDRITAINVGLWHEAGTGSSRRFRPANPLTSYVCPGKDFPLITIDSLDLSPSLLWLDIEGAEVFALQGAAETLKGCRAVIIEEAGKGLEMNVKAVPGPARQLLVDSGFQCVYEHDMDKLFVRSDDH